MSKPFRKINLILDSIIAFSFNGFAMIGNVAANFLLTLAVSKSDMGILVLFNQTVTLFANLLALGLGSTSVYIIGKNQNIAWRMVISMTGVFGVGAGMAICGLWMSRSFWLDRYFDGLAQNQWVLVLMIGSLTAGGAIFVGVLRGIGEAPIASFVNRFINVIRPVAYAFLYFSGVASVSSVIWTNGALAFMMLLVGLILVVHTLRKFGQLSLSIPFPAGVMGEAARYASIVVAGNTLLALSSRAGLYALNDLIGNKEQVATFGMALIMVQAMLVFPVSLSATIFAKTSTNKDTKVEGTVALAHRIVFTGMICLTLLSYIAANLGLRWLADGAYYDSFALYVLMSLGIPFGVTNYILINYYSGRGRIGLATFGLFLGVIGNIFLSYTMIPVFGIRAAAYAFVFSNALGAVFIATWFLREFSGIGVLGLLIIRLDDIAVIKNRIMRPRRL
jgi:O-antigen/teichoic acid export membrane protein